MSKENPLWEAPRLHDEPCAIMRMPSARRVAGSVSRAAGPADAASHTRPADMATNAGDQCATGAFGRARYCGSARTRGAQAVAEDHRGRKGCPYEMSGKWLELLKGIAPHLVRVSLMFNPATAPYGPGFLRSLETAAPSFGVKPTGALIHDPAIY